MSSTSTVHYERIEEHPVAGKPLGRHIHHDPRSLAYTVKPRAATAVTKIWQHRIPVLDQGSLGSCTGNSGAAVLGTDPLFGTVAGVTLDEQFAVDLYSDATVADPYPGKYPPTDTGSDGLSVAKVLKARGTISGYVHCTSLDATVTALQDGAVMIGINWYEGFDHPDSTGLIKISGSVRGGHEPALVGVDMERKLLRGVNSWGTAWGDHGFLTISFDDFTRLLSEQGDATQLIPASQPPPAPTPPAVTPNAADITFAAGATALTRRTRAYKAWAAALGL
jgi:hypothetical protein